MNDDRFHSPADSDAWAAGTRRRTLNSSAMACSAAERMLDCGALTTSTPRAVAAGTSTLSNPIPARATTWSRGAAASASASIVVALRMRTASASASAGSRAARSAPSVRRISQLSPSSVTAAGESSSASRTTGLSMRLASSAGGW